jgi:hypothetical protein
MARENMETNVESLLVLNSLCAISTSLIGVMSLSLVDTILVSNDSIESTRVLHRLTWTQVDDLDEDEFLRRQEGAMGISVRKYRRRRTVTKKSFENHREVKLPLYRYPTVYLRTQVLVGSQRRSLMTTNVRKSRRSKREKAAL